jgi:acyl-CoA thioester hydrolase
VRSPPLEPDKSSFLWPVRVYYEDTDAGGIVYYANYLKFLERCRTEWLRAAGIDQQALRAEAGRQFVVASLRLEYRRPARLDDELTVGAALDETARSHVHFAQAIWRGGELLLAARVQVACVDCASLTPARLPDQLVERLQACAPVITRT